MLVTTTSQTDAAAFNQTNFSLPNTGFLRVWQIVGDAKAVPPIPAMIPVSRSTWLNGCKTGQYPKPVKLSPRTTAWRVSDIRAFIDSMGAAQ